MRTARSLSRRASATALYKRATLWSRVSRMLVIETKAKTEYRKVATNVASDPLVADVTDEVAHHPVRPSL